MSLWCLVDIMPETIIFGDLPWELIILFAIMIIFIIITLIMEPKVPEGGFFAFLLDITKWITI
jgi:hypothetical protein